MIDFLSLSKDAFGLEITDANIRMMKLARRGGSLAAVAAGCAALEDGIVKNGDVKNEAKLAAAIRQAWQNPLGQNFGTRRAVISLPENKSFLEALRMPELADQDMRAAVIFEAENHIPLPLEKVYLDFETIAPAAGGNAAGREVLVAAMPREPIDARLRAVVAAGLVPVVMELESQSVARALFADAGSRLPAIAIHIGDSKTNLIIYSGNSIRFTFSIPISNRYFLETIASRAGVDIGKASHFKTEYGIEEFIRAEEGEKTGGQKQSETSGERRKIFEALVPGLVDFVQQAKKCIQYYQTHDGSGSAGQISKISVCGSGSNLKGIGEFIALKLGIPVGVASLPADTKIIESAGNGFPGRDPCAFSVAVGLAIRALDGEDGKKPAAVPQKTLRIRKIKK